MRISTPSMLCFFFNDTATTEIYTLSLHDALPISTPAPAAGARRSGSRRRSRSPQRRTRAPARSEEHTSELQSQSNLVCRLLLEKKQQHLPDRRNRLLCISHVSARLARSCPDRRHF